MDADLYSCRNCIFNPAETTSYPPQSGMGFCTIYKVNLPHSHVTTCRHLHRKDCPQFLVMEGIEQHIREFPERRSPSYLYDHGEAEYLINLDMREVGYGEKFRNGILNKITAASKLGEKWVLIDEISQNREIVYQNSFASFVRGYPPAATGWSSYKQFMVKSVTLLGQFGETYFDVGNGFKRKNEVKTEVMLNFISTIQEHGWRLQDNRLMEIDLRVADSLLNNKFSQVSGWFKENQYRIIDAIEGKPYSF